jgi:uncharacterized protein (TIGR02246 family)
MSNTISSGAAKAVVRRPFNKETVMATSDLARMFDDWVIAWTSNDPELVLALFADDCVFEDVTFGVVARGKEELRSFANRAFAAIPDFNMA